MYVLHILLKIAVGNNYSRHKSARNPDPINPISLEDGQKTDRY